MAKVKRQVWTAAATDAFFEGLCQVSLGCLESKDILIVMKHVFTSGGQESGSVQLCAKGNAKSCPYH